MIGENNNWPLMRLSECCVSIADGDHQPPPKADSGVPFVTISNIVSNKFVFSDTMYVPMAYYESLDSKRKAKAGDILYSVVGSFGIPVFIEDNVPFVFQRHIAILRPSPDTILPKFLYYTMLSHKFYQMADAAAVGAAQRTVSLTALRDMKIEVPDLTTQQKIIDVLAPYDDLIATNQKQISLLEEAAQRIYKEWFIDFHFPGHESVTIKDGIPAGWSRKILGDIAINAGNNVNVSDREKYSYYLPIDCMPKKSLGYIEVNDISLAESSLQSFKPGDIVMGAMRPYFHKVVIARDNGLTRNTCFVINAKNPIYHDFLALLIFDERSIDYATQNSVGTTMPYVRWKDFVQMPIVVPDDSLAQAFSRIISPMIEAIHNRAIDIQKAILSRDMLLVKLLS